MSSEVIETKAGVPIHLWVPSAEVEPEAMQQLYATSKLPWIYPHIAVMPDVHWGKGCTVGSVIPMRDAVSPSAVGVDIGCVDNQTEYLSPEGWKPMDQYVQGPVMQYHPETGLADFVQPVRYIKREQHEDFYHFKTKYGINQMLTGDHRVLRWRLEGNDRHEVREVVRADAHATEHEQQVLGSRARFETVFEPVLSTSLPMTDEQLRVQVMFMADGTIDGKRGVLHLSKARKIDRCEKLLDDAALAYTKKVQSDGTTIIRMTPPRLIKKYEGFWAASAKQLKVIAEECLQWDGHEGDRVFFTRDKASADFIHYAFAANGWRAVLREDVHKDGASEYRVFGHITTRVSMAGSPKSSITRVKSTDGFAYCFTVPSGFLVLRRGGNIFLTGNCGMAAVRTSLTAADLPEDLSTLRSDVEAAIPVGSNSHSKISDFAHRKMSVQRLWKEFSTLSEKVQDLFDRAQLQMGTLGGGNHFVELCLDDDDHVWLFLHSGSRNIGKTLADVHINIAKTLPQNQDLPDKDLAVFLSGTPEMEAYRRDLFWAQRYAAANREGMLQAYEQVIRKVFPQVKFGDRVNCHHNYVSQEHHYGEDLLVTRKGAISAKDGELGLIPGSMGTKSYVVKGLGNAESLTSASHGAGRRMSRSKAKKTFTVDDLIAQTEGIECRKDQGVVDEIPGAYKSIERVIELQRDNIEVVHELRQVMCVKG